jgi:hypothetical protein
VVVGDERADEGQTDGDEQQVEHDRLLLFGPIEGAQPVGIRADSGARAIGIP